MKQILLIALCALFSAPLWSQKDFENLPARVKTQMAQEEEIASESDDEFQSLMSEGMTHFENREYELAIERFADAGQRRPINVYPPVMIEDVKLAMANPPAEEEVEPKEPELVAEETTESSEPELTAEERVEQMYQAEMAKVYADLPPAPKKEEIKKPEPVEVLAEGVRVRDAEDIIADGGVLVEQETAGTESVDNEPKKPEATPSTPKEEPKSIEEVQTELAESFPDGITEEVFTEGNRTITKRVVVKDGKGNEYRKVKHGWGGVFYFKNDTSITERVWKEETE